MPKSWLSAEFWKEVRSQTIGVVIGLMLPGIAATVTVVFGFLQKFPIPVIIVFGSMVFFFSMGSMLLVEANNLMKTPEHKLRYVNTAVPLDLLSETKPKRAAQASIARPVMDDRKIEKMQLGVILTNSANFPISAYLEFADTEIEGIKPLRDDFPKPAITITPGNTLFMVDGLIQMNGTPCKTLEGHLNMRIKYGRPKHEKYALEFKARVTVFVQPNGSIQNIYTNWDSNQV